MVWIDEYKQKYKTVQKNGKCYLLLITKNIHGETKCKIEVRGKQNALAYIKNNGLKKYEEEEWIYEY